MAGHRTSGGVRHSQGLDVQGGAILSLTTINQFETTSVSSSIGEMSRLVREKDWSKTPLGPVEEWPEALRVAVDMCLSSRFPMFVWWGPELINIYNDGYVPMLGKRHPAALGRPARDTWAEIWDVVGAQAEAVMSRGEATWNECVRLVLERKGYSEDAYFTWSYSPIRHASGEIGGLFCAVTEETERVRAEAELRASEKRFRALVNANSYVLYRMSADWTEMWQLDGRGFMSDTQGPSRNWLEEYIHPDDQGHVVATVREAVLTKRVFELEHRVRRVDGTLGWTWSRAVPVLDDGGNVVEWFGAASDVTARRQAEDALRESEARYRSLFESIDEGFCVIEVLFDEAGRSVDYRFVDVNPAFEGQTGLVGVAGRRMRELAPGHEDYWFETYGRVARTGEPVRFESRAESLGRVFDVYAFRVGEPGQNRVAVLFRDIAERKRVEEQLRRGHDTFYHLIQNNPFGIYVVDADFKLRQASLGSQKVFENVRPLLGRDFAEVLRVVWAEPFASEAIARFRHTLETGEPYSAMRTIERRQDVPETEAYDWRIERITLPDGRFGVVCYFYDLSERQRWEAALAETKRKLDAATIAGEVGMFEWDVVSDRLWGDRNFTRLFGIETDANGSAPLATFVAGIHPDDRDFVLERVRRTVQTGEPYAAEYRIATTTPPRWVVARGKIERDADGRVVRFPGVVLDVTERKRAEQLLAAQSRALELIATGAPLCDALGALTGAVEEQAGGGAVAAVLLVDSDGCTLRTGAAPSLPADYCAAIDGIKAKPGLGTCADAAARNEVVVTTDLGAAESWRGLSHLPLALGLKAAWSMPIRSSEGRVLGTFGTYFPDCRGPTERERKIVEGMCRVAALAIERRRAEEALRQAKEQAEAASAAKSEFLATLSHELRTPLTPVLLTVSLLENHRGLAEELREDVATIRRNVELESRLISDLLDLTRIERGKLELDERDVDVHLMVRSAADICQREASAKLTLDLRAKRHTVRGDSTRLQQIFWNLINNAMKFTPTDGTIVVRSRDTGDGRVRVEVIDSGAGIDASVLPRLFNAFEQGEIRAARQQAGLGLGLAISKKLAEAHGGTITAASAGRGRGATFAVELPVVEEVSIELTALPPQPQRPAALRVRPLRALSVLLVEDHEPTLRVMERLLRQIGHRVTGVTSVASAMAAAAQDGFDVIISDLGLPDGSGLDVMRQLRERFEGRGIALTGYGMESDVAASREAGFAEHLTKPVDLAALEAAIARVDVTN